jgi:hypothetical protein
MRLFLFDSLRFHLQKTAFGFNLSQTVIEISLLLFKKYSGASTIFVKTNLKFTLLSLKTKSCGFFYSIRYDFIYKRQLLDLIYLKQ